jgi:hypothetical protein
MPFEGAYTHLPVALITVTPISRPLVKGAGHFLWQHWLPIFLICRFQLPCSNRARFFG